VLTVYNAVTPGTLTLANGGDIALSGGGSMVAGSRYVVQNMTTALNMGGSAEMVVKAGTAVLTGTNSYTGKTRIETGATLQVADAATNLGDGYIEFASGDWWNGPATLQSSGVIDLKVGTDAVVAGVHSVRWDGPDLLAKSWWFRGLRRRSYREPPSE
jgi:autotransporter-associated beta strand protein